MLAGMVRVRIESAYFQGLPKRVVDEMGYAYADASVNSSQSSHFTSGGILAGDTGIARLQQALDAPNTRVIRMRDVDHGNSEFAGIAYRPLDLGSLSENAQAHVVSILQKEGMTDVLEVPLVYKGGMYNTDGFSVEGGPVHGLIETARKEILSDHPQGVVVTAWIGTDNGEATALASRYGLQETRFERKTSYSPSEFGEVTLNHHLWVGVIRPEIVASQSPRRRRGRPPKVR